MARIEELENEVISLWEDMAEARGFERVMGRIICILLLGGRPLSQKEISEKTGYSIPTISKILNTLASLGSVRKTKRPGTRTALYHVEMHPLDMVSGAFVRWVVVARTMEHRVAEIQRRIGNKAMIEDDERAEKLIMMLENLSSSLPKMIGIVENAINEARRLA